MEEDKGRGLRGDMGRRTRGGDCGVTWGGGQGEGDCGVTWGGGQGEGDCRVTWGGGQGEGDCGVTWVRNSTYGQPLTSSMPASLVTT